MRGKTRACRSNHADGLLAKIKLAGCPWAPKYPIPNLSLCSDGNRNSRVLILVSCIGVKLSLLTLELCISWCLLTKTRFKRFVTAISFTCNHWQVPKRKFRVYRYVDKKAVVDRCHSIESRRRHLRQRITPLHFRPIYQKIWNFIRNRNWQSVKMKGSFFCLSEKDFTPIFWSDGCAQSIAHISIKLYL